MILKNCKKKTKTIMPVVSHNEGMLTNTTREILYRVNEIYLNAFSP